jgi:hypothetical protein
MPPGRSIVPPLIFRKAHYVEAHRFSEGVTLPDRLCWRQDNFLATHKSTDEFSWQSSYMMPQCGVLRQQHGGSMTIEQTTEGEIEQLIDTFSCPKDFRCYRSGFSTLCEAEDIGEQYLKCCEKGRGDCQFLLSFAKIHFCDCPLRFYILKKLKK